MKIATMPKNTSADKQLASHRRKDRAAAKRYGMRAVGQVVEQFLQRLPGAAKRAAQLDEKQALIRDLCDRVDNELAIHIVDVQQVNRELIVVTDSATWAERLRYALTAALPDMPSPSGMADRVRIKVQRVAAAVKAGE
jgi:hypothetical protein